MMSVGVGVARLIVAVALAAAVVAASASPVAAHSFLVRTSPAAGERLESSPGEVVLDFSEPLEGEPEVRVRGVDGGEVEVLSVGVEEGRRVRASLGPVGEGVFEVSWRVAARDGHTTEGQFAFAVGEDVPAELVVARSGGGGGGVDAAFAVVLAVLLAGLLLALGGLLSEAVVWSEALLAGDVPPAPVLAPLAVAAAGAAATMMLRLHRLNADLWPWAWPEGLATWSDLSLLAVFGLVLLALVVAQMPPLRVAAIAPLLVAVALVVWQGHAAEAGPGWGVAGVAHLVLAGVWFGALAHLALVAWRRRTSPPAVVRTGASRYARLALVSVAVTIGVGVALAVVLLSSPADLWRTTYGRLLVVKVALVAAALGLALVARRRGLPAEGGRVLTLARTTRGEAVAVAAVVAVSAFLGSTGPPGTGDRFVLGAAPLPAGAVWAADLAGAHMVQAGAVDGRLQLRVLAPGGQPPLDAELEVDAVEPDGTEVDLEPRDCGPGCAELDHRWADGTTSLAVDVASSDYEGGTAELAIEWPPGPDGADLLTEAVDATRGLSRVEVTETVSSGATAVSGPYTIGVGGDEFVASQPYAGGGVDVHRLADDGGLRVVSLVVPGSNAWAQLWISPHTGIIRRSVVVDPGHRVEHDLAVAVER